MRIIERGPTLVLVLGIALFLFGFAVTIIAFSEGCLAGAVCPVIPDYQVIIAHLALSGWLAGFLLIVVGLVLRERITQ
jgi:polyferredoxin